MPSYIFSHALQQKVRVWLKLSILLISMAKFPLLHLPTAPNSGTDWRLADERTQKTMLLPIPPVESLGQFPLCLLFCGSLSPQQEHSPGKGSSEPRAQGWCLRRICRGSVTLGKKTPLCIHPSIHPSNQCLPSTHHPSCSHQAHSLSGDSEP